MVTDVSGNWEGPIDIPLIKNILVQNSNITTDELLQKLKLKYVGEDKPHYLSTDILDNAIKDINNQIKNANRTDNDIGSLL